MRLTLILVITLVSLTACREGEAKDSGLLVEKPYKATSVDECINEKECVWYHFEKSLLSEYSIQSSDGVSEIRKWSHPIDIHVVAENILSEKAEFLNEKLQDIVNQINQVFPYGVRFSNHNKILIVLTDDPDRDFENKYGQQILEQLGQKTYDSYLTLPREREVFGVERYYEDTGDTALGYYFIKSNSSKVVESVRKVFFLMLGFGFNIPDLEFSFLSNKRHFFQPTQLDFFMIELLYHNSFVSGMPKNKIKNSFNIAYKEIIGERND
jgi:hypothetical protein